MHRATNITGLMQGEKTQCPKADDWGRGWGCECPRPACGFLEPPVNMANPGSGDPRSSRTSGNILKVWAHGGALVRILHGTHVGHLLLVFTPLLWPSGLPVAASLCSVVYHVSHSLCTSVLGVSIRTTPDMCCMYAVGSPHPRQVWLW